MRVKLRRALFIVLFACLGVLFVSRFEFLAVSAVPYAAPKRPVVTKKKPIPTPSPSPEMNAGATTVQNTVQQPGQQANQPLPAQAEPVPADKPMPIIDTSRASQGEITATYTGGGTHVLRLQANGRKADFKVKGNGKKHPVQLTLGSGDYTITYLVNTGRSKYAVAATATCYYEAAPLIDEGPAISGGAPQQISAEDARFLGVTNEINWNSSQAAILKAGSLAGGASATKDKVTQIYKFIVQNVLYDYSVYGKLPSGYLPDIDRTYDSRKGICYDFSALFGGMLRSQGIPAKLCKGSSTLVSGYHAWNAVLIDGKWYPIDTSSDSIYFQNNVSIKMFKSNSDYSATKES